MNSYQDRIELSLDSTYFTRGPRRESFETEICNRISLTKRFGMKSKISHLKVVHLIFESRIHWRLINLHQSYSLKFIRIHFKNVVRLFMKSLEIMRNFKLTVFIIAINQHWHSWGEAAYRHHVFVGMKRYVTNRPWKSKFIVYRYLIPWRNISKLNIFMISILYSITTNS